MGHRHRLGVVCRNSLLAVQEQPGRDPGNHYLKHSPHDFASGDREPITSVHAAPHLQWIAVCFPAVTTGAREVDPAIRTTQESNRPVDRIRNSPALLAPCPMTL